MNVGGAESPECAAVVATRGRGARIVPLIESILASDRQDFELVIVDQSEDDETELAVAPFLTDERIRYARSEQRGLSRGRNLGLALTQAPIVLITDDDCMVPPNWFSGMMQPFEDHPQVGVVFCTVSAVPVDKPGHTPAIRIPENHVVDSVVQAWRIAGSGLNLGAGMAIRRSMFDQLHGFDELLGAGARFGACEDNDLSWRGILAGWWTFRSADVEILHDGFRDLDELRELVIRDFYGVGGAAAKYLRTGKYAIGWFLLRWIIRFGVVDPMRNLVVHGKPTGVRRPWMLVRGVVDGLRTPMDTGIRLYIPNSQAD
jgi:GT2 family glycosyltransferase